MSHTENVVFLIFVICGFLVMHSIVRGGFRRRKIRREELGSLALSEDLEIVDTKRPLQDWRGRNS